MREEIINLGSMDKVNDDRKVNVISWIPTSSLLKGIVLISHGLHEHGLRYYELAHHLTRVGFAVYCADHYAHGKSYGTRGLIEDFTILPYNLSKLAMLVRSRHITPSCLELPFFFAVAFYGDFGDNFSLPIHTEIRWYHFFRMRTCWGTLFLQPIRR